MKRRAIISFLLIVLCFSLAGCYGNGSVGDDVVDADISVSTDDTEEATENDSEKVDDSEVTTESRSEVSDNKAGNTVEDAEAISGSNSTLGDYPNIDTLANCVSVSNRDGDVTIAIQESSDYEARASEYYWYYGDSNPGPQYAYIAVYDETTAVIFCSLVEDTTLKERKQSWIDVWYEISGLVYKDEGTVTNDLGMEFQYLHLRYSFLDSASNPADDLRFFLQLPNNTVLDIQVVDYEGNTTINVEDYQWLLDSTVLVINEN